MHRHQSRTIKCQLQKTSKPKLKLRRAALALTWLWKQSKKFCIPQSLHFPVSLPDANWQTEGRNEINNHTNKGEGGRETTRGQRNKSEREGTETSHIKRSFIISWGTRWREENKIAIPLYLTLFLCLQFIWYFSPPLPVSPLEPDCGSCCPKSFGVESL